VRDGCPGDGNASQFALDKPTLPDNDPNAMTAPRIAGLMDTPEVQYAQTSDGVRIAFSVAGSGPLVLWLNEPPLTHAEAIWGIPIPTVRPW
jgi:hypothetical protein